MSIYLKNNLNVKKNPKNKNNKHKYVKLLTERLELKLSLLNKKT